MSIETIISLSLSILVGIIILISVIRGIVVGFKKSLISGIINLVIVVVLCFITGKITNYLLNIDFSSYNFVINGEKITTFKDFFLDLIYSSGEVQNLIGGNAAAQELIGQLPLLVATPIIFTVLFWIIKLVVLIITGIVKLFMLIFRRKKKNVQQFDKNGLPIRAPKEKKHRLAGAVIGLICGLIVVLATLVPVFGVGNILLQLNNIKLNEDGSIATPENSLVLHADENSSQAKKSLLSVVLGENSQKIVDLYDNNIGINIARFTGVETLGTIVFNNLASTTIDGTKVKLIDDVANVVKVYSDYNNLVVYVNKETLTEEEMTEVLAIIDNFIGDTFEINVLNIMGDIVLPKIVDSILNDPNSQIKLPEFITKDELTNILVTAALNEIKDYPFEEIKPILVNINSVLKTLNNNHILTPVYNSIKTGTELSLNDYMSLIKNSDENFASDLTSILTEIDLVKNISNTIVNTAISSLYKFVDLTYESQNISQDKAFTTMSSALENVVNLIKTLNLNSDLIITTDSFGYAGNILNIFKDEELISENNYTALTQKASSQINDMIDNFKNSTVSNLLKSFKEPINNLSSVTDWNDEMNKFAVVFADVESLYNVLNAENALENFELSKVGKIFDNLEETKIFYNETMGVFNGLIEVVKSENILGSSFSEDFSGVLETLKISDEDLTKANITQTQIEWKKEFESLTPLIDAVLTLDTTKINDLDSVLELLDLIENFDNIEQDTTSKIYSKKMQKMLTEVLTAVKNSASGNQTITDIVTNANAKIEARTTESLQDCVIKGIFVYANTLIPNASEFSDENISAMISEIKNNITNADNGTLTNVDFRAEIDYMLEFTNCVESLQNFENLTDAEIEELFTFLDSLSQSKIFANCQSHLINFVFDTAINSITNDELGIVPLLEELKQTASSININTLLKDLETIQNNANELTNIDTSDISSLDTEAISNALEEVKATATFEDDFTDAIFENLLDEINTDIQNSQLPDFIKADVDNYINNANLTTNSYKEILDGLKDLIPSV